MNKTNTYKKPIEYEQYVDTDHLEWAKDIRFKFAKLLFHLSDEEVAIIYGHWSEDSLGASWIIEDILTEKGVLDMLSKYRIEDGKIWHLINQEKVDTISNKSYEKTNI